MVNLVAKLSGIPSQQSPKHGFAGMVQQVVVYTLNGAEPCLDHIKNAAQCTEEKTEH